MLGPPEGARVFRTQRRIRLSDTSARGSLRLDAAARYIQDVATDDVADAGIDDGGNVWIVRRAAIQVIRPFRTDTAVDVATWSGGLGPRWAARRTSIAGDAGGAIEAETTWVLVSPTTLRPARVSPEYARIYGDGAAPQVKLRLSTHVPGDAGTEPWPLRVTDADILGHVNNAVYWQAVEEELARAGWAGFSGRAVLEYRRPIDLGDGVVIRSVAAPGRLHLWFVVRDEVAAAADLGPPPG